MSDRSLPYRLIALDLDGTLLHEDMSISPRVRRALRRAQEAGIRLTLASGRGYPSVRRWVDELHIDTPVICYQGSVITDPLTHRRVFQRAFGRELVRELVAFARARDVSLTLYVADEIYVENKQNSDAYYDKWFGLPLHVVEDLTVALPGDPDKFLIVGEGEAMDALQPIVEATFGARLQIVRSHRFFVEGLASDASKGHALAWLAERYGIPREHTMAIGDSGNDRAMIAWAGLGVAMGNASEEALSVADWVAPTIDEDGVAEAIERFCLDGARGCATRVVRADDPAAVSVALEALRAGETVVFPTDTVYGVAADPWDAAAVERLYQAKERPRDLAIPILVSAPHHIARVAMDLPAGYEALARAFWPGGLTLVVPAHPTVPAIVRAGGATIAVRMPDHPVARAIIEAAGGVLAVTSANRSGRRTPVTAAEALADLDGRVAVVVDGGTCPGGAASTIVDLVSAPPRLLRAGEIGLAALRRVLPELAAAE